MLVGGARGVRAQEEDAQKERSADAAVQVYSDSDNTTVLTLIGKSTWGKGDDETADAHVTVDAVSSASVDVISSASRRFVSRRLELGGGGSKRVGPGSASANAVLSTELDWTSISLQLGWEQPLARKNASLSFAYGATYNWIGDARPGYNFSESLWAHTWEIGFSQLLDRRTRVGITHTGQYQAGYTASPYRVVLFGDGSRSAENQPDRRVRAALTAFGNRYLGKNTGLSGSYRFYVDSWNVVSHTLQASLMIDVPDERMSLQLFGRGYTQTAADFYRDQYDTPLGLDYWTFDKKLSSLWNAGGGAMLIWRRDDGWRIGLRLEGYYFGFRNFSELPTRTALIAGAQLGADW